MSFEITDTQNNRPPSIGGRTRKWRALYETLLNSENENKWIGIVFDTSKEANSARGSLVNYAKRNGYTINGYKDKNNPRKMWFYIQKREAQP